MPKKRITEDECCAKKQKWLPSTYQNPWPVPKNNFFAPLRDLSMENAEMGSEGNSPETNEYGQR
jgi:hypothetical protein